MIIVGVESSCDETALSLVRNGTEVLSSTIASQISMHAKFGGVVPEIAAREHLQALPFLWQNMMKEAGLSIKDIDAVAVTRGPGLIGALLVGLAFARGFAARRALPLIPVDHVHAHLHGALLGLSSSVNRSNLFPALSLVVSGGHTHLYLMKSHLDFQLIGQSLDDACGECFDKAGKILGLPFPGGPWIEKSAKMGDKQIYPMPKMLDDKSKITFSYSGLKTHVLNLWRKLEKDGLADDSARANIAASFQEEALGQLIRKLHLAEKLYPHVNSIIVAGGVSANQRFREMANLAFKIPIYFPALNYCSDNAAMISALGYFLYSSSPSSFPATADWDAYSRYGASDIF